MRGSTAAPGGQGAALDGDHGHPMGLTGLMVGSDFTLWCWANATPSPAGPSRGARLRGAPTRRHPNDHVRVVADCAQPRPSRPRRSALRATIVLTNARGGATINFTTMTRPARDTALRPGANPRKGRWFSRERWRKTMSNNRRRQRTKRERRRQRAEACTSVRPSVSNPEPESPRPVPWCPIPNPASYGGCLFRAAWESWPLWFKMLDYRERLAWSAEPWFKRELQRVLREPSPEPGHGVGCRA